MTFMGHKAVETTRTINARGPGTANERVVQWCFRKFCQGEKSLEDEEHSSRPSKVNGDQSRVDQRSRFSYNYMRSC